MGEIGERGVHLSFLKWCLNVVARQRLRWYVWVNGGLTEVSEKAKIAESEGCGASYVIRPFSL